MLKKNIKEAWEGMLEGLGMAVEPVWYVRIKSRAIFIVIRLILNTSSIILILWKNYFREIEIVLRTIPEGGDSPKWEDSVYVTVLILSAINGIYWILYILMVIGKALKTILRGEWIIRNSPIRKGRSAFKLITYGVKASARIIGGGLACVIGSIGIDGLLSYFGKEPIIMPAIGKALNIKVDTRSLDDKIKELLDKKAEEEAKCREELLDKVTKIESIISSKDPKKGE